ncbi:MAG: NYN domain-containing protein, partial [Selenomonadaceae bacterium]|nr:NYN domain-containing protein [Selenomonadaceae bacterium]
MDHADMEKMDNKIAVMIDSDNTQLSKLESVLQEVSTHGRIVVKRAYGNWQKENLKHWESELKRLAIKAEQQFDYTVGKNATDMALVIDTITLLHRNIYDAFVIVSSDSDFTPLAIYLRESGVYVMGVGEKKT